MPTPVNKSTAPHYLWQGVCDGWPLVSNGALSVKQERMPKGTREARHTHNHARQFFYVLSGTLTLEVAGETVVLGVEDGLEIGPDTPHQAQNNSAADVEFLVISTPNADGDRTEA